MGTGGAPLRTETGMSRPRRTSGTLPSGDSQSFATMPPASVVFSSTESLRNPPDGSEACAPLVPSPSNLPSSPSSLRPPSPPSAHANPPSRPATPPSPPPNINPPPPRPPSPPPRAPLNIPPPAPPGVLRPESPLPLPPTRAPSPGVSLEGLPLPQSKLMRASTDTVVSEAAETLEMDGPSDAMEESCAVTPERDASTSAPAPGKGSTPVIAGGLAGSSRPPSRGARGGGRGKGRGSGGGEAPSSMSHQELSARFENLCAQVSTMQQHADQKAKSSANSLTSFPVGGLTYGGASPIMMQPVVAPGWSVIDGAASYSMEAPRAQAPPAPRTQDPYLEITELKEQLKSSEDSRRALVKQLDEKRAFHERSESRLRDGYEGRLAEAAKTRTALQQRVKELEGEGPRRRLAANGEEAKLTVEELKELRENIAVQDTLLAGYQAENEVAMNKIKAMDAEAKERESMLANENAKLQGGIDHLRRLTSQSTVEEGNHLKKLLNVEAKLCKAKEDAEARERELKQKIQRLRDAKMGLEARIGGVDLKQMETENLELRAVEDALAHCRSEHAHEVAALQRKLEWYVENQEIVSEKDGRITELQRQLSEVEERVALYDIEEFHAPKPASKGAGRGRGRAASEASTSKSGNKISAGASARIRHLERQVKELQEALATRNPSSLAALIQATKPSLEDEEQVKEMRGKIGRLERALEMKGDEMEDIVRGLRQEHDKVRHALEAKLKAAVTASKPSGAGTLGRAKELERQLEEVRALHARKQREAAARIEELESRAERQEAELKQAYAKGFTGGSGARPKARAGSDKGPWGIGGTMNIGKAEQERVAMLEGEAAEAQQRQAEAEALVEEWKERAMAAEAAQSQDATGAQKAKKELENELARTRRQLAMTAGTSGASRRVGSGRGRGRAGVREAWGASAQQDELQHSPDQAGGHGGEAEEVQQLRQRLGCAELSLHSLQRAHTDVVERGAMQRLELEQNLARLQPLGGMGLTRAVALAQPLGGMGLTRAVALAQPLGGMGLTRAVALA
ncbi:hypothetical protein CYMTET_11216 [Cymbomonas tetramitiformis]|uniref:Centrosomal protein of 162 kDa n=1 Tax=Cymbomonas tetramitiformis TaxID=36881 RepID=A0AAE0LD80_9CHLO|nr:hypothetical protein CYMTET_11216 [Cymbomonas tetramitiformis]